MVQPRGRNFGSFLAKLSTLLPYDPATGLHAIYPNELKAFYPHKNLHMNVCSSFTHNCPKLEATGCLSVGEWMKKTGIHPNNRISFRAKKKEDSKP